MSINITVFRAVLLSGGAAIAALATPAAAQDVTPEGASTAEETGNSIIVTARRRE